MSTITTQLFRARCGLPPANRRRNVRPAITAGSVILSMVGGLCLSLAFHLQTAPPDIPKRVITPGDLQRAYDAGRDAGFQECADLFLIPN